MISREWDDWISGDRFESASALFQPGKLTACWSFIHELARVKRVTVSPGKKATDKTGTRLNQTLHFNNLTGVFLAR